ncbi:MAG: patatin-like phospholipase family protein [Pseudomonadota bacterium]
MDGKGKGRPGAGIALAASALILAGCAHPLTSPPGPSCATFMAAYEPTDLATRERALLAATAPASPLEEALADKLRREAVAAPALARPAAPVRLDVLVLSGGGSYGAYGAGFLTGLYGAGPPAAPEIALKDYDVVTGISTGAVMATYVWGAIILDGQPADPAGNRGLKDLATLYQVTDKDLFTKQGLLPAVLGSNGLYDPRGLLERRVHDGVRSYAGLLRSGDGQRVDIGAVNVRNGKFYRFDLKAMVGSPDPEALDCYAEAVLASAAIPLAFPPRFIDGEPYYDGGIRFATYYGDVLPRLAAMAARAGRKLELNIRIIVNGNQSPNEPGADAAQARDCDAASLGQVHARCPPVANSLLGSLIGGGGAKGLVPRAVEDIMVDQIGIDSTHRIYGDWRAADVLGTFKYTFVSNAEMAAPPPDAGVAGACQRPAASTDQFDRAFMDCLFAVGQAKGRAGRWSFESVK